MKFSEETSYPHPVLAPWSTDISGASFSTTITFREESESKQVSVHCATVLDQVEILELIRSGSATFGCFIKCLDTGFRRLQTFGFPEGTHHFAPGALLGRVSIRPVIWAADCITNYHPKGVHAEFGSSTDIAVGQILALDEEQTIEVTRPPIAPIESIFEIVSSDEVTKSSFEVDTGADRITVRMDKDTYKLVQALRQTNDVSRTVVMNSLYVPVVMEVLDQVIKGGGFEQFEQYRWLYPFRDRCQLLDVDIEKLNLLSDAQRLLEQPFESLHQLVDDEVA